MSNILSNIDKYPDETKSFNALPQDSPLQFLDYGGILTMICNLVQQERKKNRNKRRAFLIKKVNNINLDITINKIKEDAKSLQSYVPKEWYKGSITKANILKFFEKHDISLKYLEDVYIHQSKGIPVIKMDALIKINKPCCEYGVVIDNTNNTCVKYLRLDKLLLPSKDYWENFYDLTTHDLNNWKCEVVGEFDSSNWQRYNKAVADNNRDQRMRREFWNNHPILRNIPKPCSYNCINFDVMNGEIPQQSHWIYRDNRNRIAWDIFMGCIDEKLRNEKLIYNLFSLQKHKTKDYHL